MTDITLYKFTREDGGITVSPDKPDCDYTTLHRLIADESMVLSNGADITTCIDTDNVSAWTEIPALDDEESEGA